MATRFRWGSALVPLLAMALACTSSPTAEAQAPTDPPISGTWDYHPTPEAVGRDQAGLDSARSYFDSLESAAMVLVFEGKVLQAWGSYSQEYLTHSARKSFMSGMYGIYAESGELDLDKTLAELGIDDQPPLSSDEKRAKIIDLLAARSGVYHTAAAESQGMHDYKPDRGTYGPGEFWCYNNWDFNALSTIFNQETGLDFFEALVSDIGERLEMEDFDLEDTQYQHQPDRSIHPAYHFQMSARDAARFGQLFLNGGEWMGHQVVPASWVEESTRPLSDSGVYIPGTHYGYMWWVFQEGYGAEEELESVPRYQMYAALGAYGQVIMVIPDADLVFVHRVNSYEGMNVSVQEWMRLLDMILQAHPRRWGPSS